MVEILDKDDLLSLSDAAYRCPGHVSQSAVWRWARKGLKARSGIRLRLRHVRVGGRLYTTQEDLAAFFADLAEEDAKHFARPAPAESPSPGRRCSLRQRERDIEAANARIEARGA